MVTLIEERLVLTFAEGGEAVNVPLLGRTPELALTSLVKGAETASSGSWASFFSSELPRWELDSACLDAGLVHPRIRRNEALQIQREMFEEEWTSGATAAEPIFTALRSCLRAIEPVDTHLQVYGHDLRHILVLACTEVEAHWRGILEANGQTGRFTTTDYIKLCVPMRLADWSVRLYPSSLPALSPFRSWTATQPTQSLPWYDAYNATKHDREGALHRATLGNVINATAALYIMLSAQWGEDCVTMPPLTRFIVEEQPDWPLKECYFGPAESEADWETRNFDFALENHKP